ncbi:MAG: AAA family ATPase [Nitrospiraceae bacterium]|nr:AAA family ATPase [Nitrospiraceae bacterium]
MSNDAVNDSALQMLNSGSKQLVSAALRKVAPGIHHWLLTLLERHGPLAESMSPDLKAAAVAASLRHRLEYGSAGEVLAPAELARQALEAARERGHGQEATERDLAAVILKRAGFEVNKANKQAPLPDTPLRPPPLESAPAGSLGVDLARQAAARNRSPVVGRERELEHVIRILCASAKRNPILVGDAGVGKTAIAEELARRIAAGKIPAIPASTRVISVAVSSILSGSGVRGRLEERITRLLDRVREDDDILFIDEAHMLRSADGGRSMADIFKPALACGDMRCIAATTDEEYHRYIQVDKALARRFQYVAVPEPNAQATLAILHAQRQSLSENSGITVDDNVLEWMVDFAGARLHNRCFPDKAIDVLEQSVGYAVANSLSEVRLGDAERVVREMVGEPLDLDDHLGTLRAELADEQVIAPEAQDQLTEHLAVTTRGLDLRHRRPNACVLMAGAAARRARALAATLARALFGSEDRVLALDLATYSSESDRTRLWGAPPGFIGYGMPSALEHLSRTPWCVLRLDNVDRCHPYIRALLAQAFADGYLTKADGATLYLSDAIVVMSMKQDARAKQRAGFIPRPDDHDRDALEDALGAEMMREIDLVCTSVPESPNVGEKRVRALLDQLAGNFRVRRLVIRFDSTLVDWAYEKGRDIVNEQALERLLEQQLSTVLASACPGDEGLDNKHVAVGYEGDKVVINPITVENEEAPPL